MVVTFLNEKTGEVREVKIGRSWILFLFAGFYGMPLFLRKLNIHGMVMLTLSLLLLALIALGKDKSLLFIVAFIASVYFYMKGNKLTALNYIRLGYKIRADRFRKEKAMRVWGIPETAFIEDPQEVKKDNEIA